MQFLFLLIHLQEACCIVAMLSSGIFFFRTLDLDESANWSSKSSRADRERKEVFRDFTSVHTQHTTYVQMPNATTWRQPEMIDFLSNFIDDIMGAYDV